MPQEEIALLLRSADHPRARAHLEHFRAEFDSARMNRFRLIERAGLVRYQHADGQYGAGVGYDSAWSGARPIGDIAEGGVGVRVAAAVAPHLAASVATFNNDTDELQLNLGAGFLGAWIGRREVGYGVGDGGGLVLDASRLDALGVFLTRPLRIPLLGPTRFEMHLGRIDNVLNLNGTERDIEPWFWTARGSFEPFSGVRVGINRGMMFGGEGNLPVTFERVARNVAGFYTEDGESSFANQIISIDFRLRLPGAPLTAYLDWGSDDAAGGWWDVPAILGGLEYVRVDSLYDVAIGVEHLQFSATCCGNSIWYRNAWFRGSWADGEALLGHPLGGHGREWRLFASGSFGSSVQANAALFTRRRRDENILSPELQGQSSGLRAGADIAAARYIRVILNGEAEWGDADWSSSRLSATLRYRF